MSKNLYALALTVFTTAGIVFAAMMSRISQHWQIGKSWGAAGFALGVLVVSLIGVAIFTATDNPVVSLFGYALVAGPFGLLLGPFVAQYTQASVLEVLAITTMLVIVLGLVGVMIPESLEGWGSWLLGGLLILLLGYFIVPIFSALGLHVDGALTVLDWVGVVLFGGLVIFDLTVPCAFRAHLTTPSTPRPRSSSISSTSSSASCP